MNNSILLQSHQLSKTYQDANFFIQVLKNINFTVQTGEMITIIGHSGSGKSTLLHLLGGLDTPTHGKVIFNGQILHQISEKTRALIRNQQLGFIYQFHHLLSDFNTLENIAMPLMIQGKKFKHAKIIAKKMLKLVNLHHRDDHYPYELSGGERQRVAIARALVNKPILVLADEPTGNLDKKTANNIFQLLHTININYGTTFLVVTHDICSNTYFNRTLELCHGELKP
ncbi:lipoprotein-releasing ABC transporter ATP-binding protein LolD [Blochmannia endosymbiont of Polyrhachis (Hedomyrma) turneri]|uniref:lipoprotein-releasing ABC transporter ATP-binding protein LolD n=1 Tax=Blochmannia endosymbiont of Polyrhachis (Hedomyrma) turneri TaxID=1505596 RepID=UPI00061A89CC|nr:lipoprotein-releasing ABC transporter ATP-binding protein LolD [Blochmannia endosymbiont of Polyrhachis (Hedomyrma) turneri]AKC59958.1 Lipoprotein-releasing system ATP-binding protein LolD [Blochmannia endosymbiont of Polyrhachis (Hedomyrma) turneri]